HLPLNVDQVHRTVSGHRCEQGGALKHTLCVVAAEPDSPSPDRVRIDCGGRGGGTWRNQRVRSRQRVERPETTTAQDYACAEAAYELASAHGCRIWNHACSLLIQLSQDVTIAAMRSAWLLLPVAFVMAASPAAPSQALNPAAREILNADRPLQP